MPTTPDPDHLCTVDEAITRLRRIREQYGNVGLMICLDGAQRGEAASPYLPVNALAVDDDEPSNPIALCCVALGNHPFGPVIRLHAPHWKPAHV